MRGLLPQVKAWKTSFRAMNTAVEVHLAVRDEQRFRDLVFKVQHWFEIQEKRFSRFLPDSELSRLNGSSGWVSVSLAMKEVLSLSRHFSSLSEGIYEPAVLPELKRVGYTQSFEQLSSADQSQDVYDSEETRFGYREWAFDAGSRMFRRGSGTALDLGGIVKGWCVYEIAQWLKGQEDVQAACVNAGGDLTVWSRSNQPVDWSIRIENPFKPDEDLGGLQIRNGSAATSSRLKRRWVRRSGREAHHLIDPRTGSSAESDIVQCTVTGGRLPECEVIAKCMCILGEVEGLAWLDRRNITHEMLWMDLKQRLHYRGSEQQCQMAAFRATPDVVHFYPEI